jgi:hypothetical protein
VGFSLLLAIASSDRALACACCTNQGQRYVEKVTFDAGKREEVEQLRFGKKAHLYVGARGVESIKGIAYPSEHYALRVGWGDHSVIFTFRDYEGHWGVLGLTLPDTVSVFEVDPRNGEDQGQGPTLYKEWKLTGKVTGLGAFKGSSGAGQLLTLILQGRGNSCTSAADFTHWTLVMQGPKAHYLLFGDLVWWR